jgi:predicted RNA-binding Zn ribbon-like protein
LHFFNDEEVHDLDLEVSAVVQYQSYDPTGRASSNIVLRSALNELMVTALAQQQKSADPLKSHGRIAAHHTVLASHLMRVRMVDERWEGRQTENHSILLDSLASLAQGLAAEADP